MLIKSISISISIIISNLILCLPIKAQIPDIFTPYMEGREAAIAANWRDAYYYQQTSIQQAINMFLRTKNYNYLCIAKYYGSHEAAQVLYDNDMRCIVTRN